MTQKSGRKIPEFGLISPKCYPPDSLCAVLKEARFRMRLPQNWPDQGTVIQYENFIAGDFSALSFLSAYDPEWESKVQAGLDRPSCSSTATTQGGDRLGKQRSFSIDETNAFVRMIAAFDAEKAMTNWGYMPE